MTEGMSVNKWTSTLHFCAEDTLMSFKNATYIPPHITIHIAIHVVRLTTYQKQHHSLYI